MTDQIKACIVRIFEDTALGTVAGAGFLVDGEHVLTCAHVIEGALDLQDGEDPTDRFTVALDFPFYQPRVPHIYRAVVVQWRTAMASAPPRSPFRNDIALLRLTEPPPRGTVPACLGTPRSLWKHEFGAYGFPCEVAGETFRTYDSGVWVEGIVRDVDADGAVQVDHLDTAGYVVTRGFSGAPAWDSTERQIVGMIVAADELSMRSHTARFVPAAMLLEALPSLPTARNTPEPYRGLEAFREQDAPYFYGRAGVTDELEDKVRREGLVAIIGPSGCGKSSLVMAGLLPRFRGEPGWVLANPLRPGDKPFRALAQTLLPLLHPNEQVEEYLAKIGGLAQVLEDDPLTWRELLAHVGSRNQPRTHLLLVIDQFEELFTLTADRVAQEHFLDGLASLCQGPAPRSHFAVSVLLTLRTDFLGAATIHRSFTAALQNHTFFLGAMSPRELESVIELPARELGASFDPGLTKDILRDVGTDPGDLPLLEFALTQLWRNRTGSWLTHEGYAEIGGVEQALGQYAEESYLRLSEADRRRAEEIFLQLVRVDEDTEPTRRIVTRDDVPPEDWTLVTRLADVRLVVTQQRRTNTGAPEDTVEIVHEALIRGWSRMHHLVQEHQEFLRWREQLERERRTWEADGQEVSDLLRGPRLDIALQWLGTHRAHLHHFDCAFIEESLAKREQEETEERDRQERELLAARKVAESQSRQARLATVAAIVFAVALVVVLLLARYALQQQQQAAGEHRVAQSRQLVASALSLLPSNPGLALLLAVHAARIADTPQTEDALRDALLDSHAQRIVRGSSRAVRDLAFSPDGRLLAAVSDDHTARLWDTGSGRLVSVVRHVSFWPAVPLDPYGPALSFSPNGHLLVTASDDDMGRVWNVNSGRIACLLRGHSGVVYSASFSLDGRSVVTVSADHTARVWRTGNCRLVSVLRGPVASLVAAAFNRAGTRVMAVDSAGGIWLWNAAGGAPAAHFVTGASEAIARFSPDGRALFAADAAGDIYVWDAGTGRLTAHHLAPISPVDAIAFGRLGHDIALSNQRETVVQDIRTGVTYSVLHVQNPNGIVDSADFSPTAPLIATANQDKTVSVWNWTTPNGTLVWTLAGHTAPVESVTFSPGGGRLASGSDDGVVYLWSAPADTSGHVLRGDRSPVQRVILPPDGPGVLAVHQDGRAELWSTTSDRLLTVLGVRAYSPGTVTFTSDGRRILLLDRRGTLHLIDARTGAESAVHSLGSPPFAALSFSPDTHVLSAATSGGRILTWAVSSGRLRSNIRSHLSAIEAITVSPDDRYLAAVDASSTVRVFAGGPHQLSGPLLSIRGTGRPIFSSDGRLIAVREDNGPVEVWRVHTGRLVATIPGAVQVDAMAFSPDGKRLVTGDDEGYMHIWDFLAGVQIPGSSQDTDRINSVAFSHDGSLIVTASDDGTIRVWEANTGEQLEVLGKAIDSFTDVPAYAVDAAEFTSTGNQVIARLADGTVHSYRCDMCGSLSDLIRLADARAVRGLGARDEAPYMPS